MLFPRPRADRRNRPGTGPTAARPCASSSTRRSRPEGYALDVGPDGVAIAHRDDRGLRYARATARPTDRGAPGAAPRPPDPRLARLPGPGVHARREPRPRADPRDARAARRSLRARTHQPLRALHRAHVRVRRPRGRVARRVADDGRRRPLARRHVRGRRHRARREPELLRSHGPLARARAVPEPGGGARRLRAHPRVPHGADGARPDAGERGVRADAVRRAAPQLHVARAST